MRILEATFAVVKTANFNCPNTDIEISGFSIVRKLLAKHALLKFTRTNEYCKLRYVPFVKN